MEAGKIYFFTATIYKWIPILQNDQLKEIVLHSLKYMVAKSAINLYAYVIMPNHIHLMLKPLNNSDYKNIQLSLMRFTAQKIKFYLIDHDSPELVKFEVNSRDRKYQFWQRNPLAVEMYSREVIEQKLDYIHRNPVTGKWKLAARDLDYVYSSIRFYEEDESTHAFLTHYMDDI